MNTARTDRKPNSVSAHRVAGPTRLALFLAAALLVPAASVNAQASGRDALEDVSEQINVDLVTLEIFVSDRKGRPAPDLTAADFVVEEDGEEIDILSFRNLSSRNTKGLRRDDEFASSDQSNPNHPATVVIYLDESLLLPIDLARISGSLARFIKESLPPGLGLVLARHGETLEVIVPHTTSPDVLLQALETIVPDDGAVSNELSIARALERIDLEKRLFSGDRALGLFAEDSVPCTSGWAVVVSGARAHAAEASDRLGRSISSLARFISGLSGIPGRKSLLYISGGLQMRPGTEVFTSLADLCADRQLEVATLLQEYQQINALYALAAHANANRVTLYPFDGAGVDTGQDGSRAFFETRANLNESLTLLGEETGGRAVLNANYPDHALRAVSQDLRDYYEISYRPDRRRSAPNHLIQVKLRNAGKKKIRFRRTVRAKTTEDKLTERLVSTLLLGVEDNPLGIQAELGEPREADGPRVRVPVHLRVPRDNLFRLASDDRPAGGIRLFLMARDDRNRGSGIRQHIVSPDELQEGEDLFEFVIDMELEPSEYFVALGVRDEISQKTSYVRLELR